MQIDGGFGSGEVEHNALDVHAAGAKRALNFADGERRSVASRLLGRRAQVGEESVGHTVGIQSETMRIVGVKALQEHLGSQRAATGCARLDPRSFVNLVSKGGDFHSTTRCDLTNVKRRSPVKAKTQHDLGRLQGASRRDFPQRVSQRSRRRDARVGRQRLRTTSLHKKERDDAVADMPSDESAGVDDTTIGLTKQAAPEREVTRRGQSAGKRRGRFEVGEQNRGWPARGFGHALHAFKVAQVSSNRDGRQHGHTGSRLGDQRGSNEPTGVVVNPERGGDRIDPCSNMRPVPRERHRGRIPTHR